MKHNLRDDACPVEALARLGVEEYRTWRPIDTMWPSEMIGTEQYGRADLGFCEAVSARRWVIRDLVMQRITGVITASLPEISSNGGRASYRAVPDGDGLNPDPRRRTPKGLDGEG